MKRRLFALVVIVSSIQAIGCDSGATGGGGGAAPPAPAAGAPAKGAGDAVKGTPPALANPDGPKNDR